MICTCWTPFSSAKFYLQYQIGKLLSLLQMGEKQCKCAAFDGHSQIENMKDLSIRKCVHAVDRSCCLWWSLAEFWCCIKEEVVGKEYQKILENVAQNRKVLVLKFHFCESARGPRAVDHFWFVFTIVTESQII